MLLLQLRRQMKAVRRLLMRIMMFVTWEIAMIVTTAAATVML